MRLSVLRQSLAHLRVGVVDRPSPLARIVVAATNHTGVRRSSDSRTRWCPSCGGGDSSSSSSVVEGLGGSAAVRRLVRAYSVTPRRDARTVRDESMRPPPQKHAWMPLHPLTMVSAHSATDTHPAMATFRIPPIMTKHDIREYLTKIYRLPVVNVNTMNYEGKRKRIQSSTGKLHYYKYAKFKKAVVTFNPKFLTDVGLGTQTPELDEHQEEDSTASR